MGDLEAQELAQLGIKKIEDAVVGLLTRHSNGMAIDAITSGLGLGTDLPDEKRHLITVAILDLLVHSGRILRDESRGVYLDNPDKI
jgi:hypothetical protein